MRLRLKGLLQAAWDRQIQKKTGLWPQFLRKWRRWYYGHFQPEKVKASIQATRQGECHRCGLCCEFLFRCPFLGKDAEQLPYCRIYGDLRPANCHIYPFDAIDSEIPQCGYTFREIATGEVSSSADRSL